MKLISLSYVFGCDHMWVIVTNGLLLRKTIAQTVFLDYKRSVRYWIVEAGSLLLLFIGKQDQGEIN